jgi:hypothetical protein
MARAIFSAEPVRTGSFILSALGPRPDYNIWDFRRPSQ